VPQTCVSCSGAINRD